MIDIETLGTECDALVLSVGMVHFTPDGVVPNSEYYALLRIEDQTKTRSLTASTIRWWMMQSEEARKAVFDESNTTSIHVSTLWSNLNANLATTKNVWARGPHFDLTILESLFIQNGLSAPWRYYAPRDSRTILDFLPADHMPERHGTAHNALDDAYYEAQCVAKAQFLLGPLVDSYLR